MEQRGTRITWKAILIGVVFSALLSWWAGYAEMIIHASPLANDYCAPVSLFTFFVVAAGLNPLLAWLGPKWRLGGVELAAIYIMLLAAAAIPTRGFVSMIGPVVTGWSYYANPENNWKELVGTHIEPLTWVVPQGSEAIRGYYEAVPKGTGIPWDVWKLPFVSWMGLCLAVSLLMLCVAVIFRKQWVEHERIVYPLMQFPMELAKSGESSGQPVWRSTLLWLGFALPFVFYCYQGIAFYLPDHLRKFDLNFSFPMFHGASAIRVHFSPISFAFLYFCRSDMLLGLAVFPFLVSFAQGWMKTTGTYPQVPKLGIWSYDPVEAFFGAGAMLVFVGRILYFARKHLRHVFSATIGLSRQEDGGGEIISYRAAVLGALLGAGFMVAWLMGAGMVWWQAMLYLVLAFTIFMALTRVIAEAGLPTALPPVVAGDFMFGLLGSRALSPQNWTALGFTYPYHAEMRCFLLCHASNGLKMAHETIQGTKRWLFTGIMLAVLVAFVVAMIMMIYFPYRDGGLNLQRWTFENTAKYSWLDASSRISQARGPVFEGFPLMGYGAGLMTVLLLCAHWIPRWPIHPGALVVSFHWAGEVLWSSALWALIVKTFILKYGGGRFFTHSRPFFYGLILGEVVAAALWVIIDGVTGTRGNYLTSFF